MANGHALAANGGGQWHSDGGSNPFKGAHPRVVDRWTAALSSGAAQWHPDDENTLMPRQCQLRIESI